MKRVLFTTAVILLAFVFSVLLSNPGWRSTTRRIQTVNNVPPATFVFAQAEQVKGKAKDLKKKIESQQTNQVDKTNPPPKK
jgi:hypothetical protein